MLIVKLQTKSRIAFIVFTAMIFIQVLIVVSVGLLTSFFSNSYAEGFFDIARDLIEWRNEQHYQYVLNAKRGYSLDIE